MTSIKATQPVAGDEIDDTWTGYVNDTVNGAGTGYAFLVASGTQSLTNNTWTAILMDGTEVFDEENAHSSVTNPSRYTAVYDGIYEVSGCVSFAANATGGRGAAVAKNGTRIQGGTSNINTNTSAGTVCSVDTPTVLVSLGTGDYVEIHGIQLSTASLNTNVQSDNCSSMTVTRKVRS